MRLDERPEIAADTEFELHVLESVEKSGDGYALKQQSGWSLFIDDPGFEPQAGETARFYGRGIGSPVRGVVIGDRIAYYRTAAEDQQRHTDETYPRTAAEALARWDSGRSLFTIEMGGLGPGYEQTIHIAVFEIIRALAGKNIAFDTTQEFAAAADAVLDAIGGDLGMSGAQAGAAKQCAFRVLRDGWQATMLKVPDDRRIQVSKAWPHLREQQPTT